MLSRTVVSRRSFLRTAGVVGSGPVIIGTTVAKRQTDVNSCVTIDSPGRYRLVNDIAHDSGPCIEITADRVIFDGNGHTIRSIQPHTNIVVTGDKVTVQGVRLTAGLVGIEFLDTTRGVVRDVYTANERGIVLTRTTNTRIVTNHCDDDFACIQLVESHENSLRRNDLIGEAAITLINSDANELRSNSAHRNTFGMGLVESNGNALIRNEAMDGFQTGFTLFRSHQNVLFRNAAVANDHFGFVLREADDNLLFRNTACDNGDEQIATEGDSDGNRLIRNRTSCD